MKTFIILDIETTGLQLEDSVITEIAAIKVSEEELTIIDSFESLIKIKGKISPFIEGLTGINDKLLKRKGRKLSQVLEELSLFCKDDIVYAHYAPFDKKFIRAAFKQEGLEYQETKWIDTIKIFKDKLPGHENYKLETLIKDLGIANKESHRGMQDCIHTLNVLQAANGLPYEHFETAEYKMFNILREFANIAFILGERYDLSSNEKTFSSLSMAIGKSFKGLDINKKYLAAIKKVNKTVVIRNREKENVQNPFSFVGTAMDQMVEYFYNKKEYKKRMKNDIKFPKTFIKDLNNELNENDFAAIAFMIHYYRGGKEEDLEIAINYSKNKVIDNFYANMIKPYIRLAKEQSSFLPNDTIFNPILGSIKSGLSADGDYIIDGKLCEMKTSKQPSFLLTYINQLITYILLNDLLEEKFQISKKVVIFWNPVYKIFEEFEIFINEEIESEFLKMLRAYSAFFQSDYAEYYRKIRIIKLNTSGFFGHIRECTEEEEQIIDKIYGEIFETD